MTWATHLVGLFDRPAYLVDRSRALIASNQTGGPLSPNRQWIGVLNGRLQCRFEMHDRLLAAALSKVLEAEGPRQQVRLAGRGLALPVVLAIARCSAPSADDSVVSDDRGSAGRESALVLVHDLQASVVAQSASVAEMLDLTQAEARVATRLASGLTVHDIAAAGGTSICTVRTQIRSILQKLGVQRQVDIVRLLAALPGHPDRTGGATKALPSKAAWHCPRAA